MSIRASKKKILFIHHCGTMSGAANSLIALISNLDPERFERIVLCPEGTAVNAFRKIADRVEIIPELPELISIAGYQWNHLRVIKAFLLWGKLKEVTAICKQIDPAIIHLNELSLTALACSLKKSGFKIVVHARVVLSHKTPILNRIIKQRLKKYADHVFCIDGSVYGPLKTLQNISIVYNGYKFSAAELTPVEGPMNGHTEKFTILFLANLIRYKGIFDLIEAARRIKDLPGIEILVAGANSRNDAFFKTLKGKVVSLLGFVADNRKKIAALIEKEEIHAVKLLGHVDNIRELIQRSDLLVFPSYMNGPSRSIFEAGVLGKPSILALRDKVEDVLEDGVTGIIIAEGAPAEMEAAFRKLYADPQLVQKMGANARNKYLELNNPVTNTKKVEAVYDKLLDR